MDTRHRACTHLLPLVCLLSLGGCEQIDKLTGKEEQPPAPETETEPEPEAKAEVKQVDPREAELEALRAEAEAAKEQLAAANAANKELQGQLDAPPEAEDNVGTEKELGEGEKGPVSITAAKLESHKAEYGHVKDRFQLKAAVDVTVNEVKKGGVYAKATCLVGEEVAVDVVTLGNQYGDFGKLAAGDKSTLESTFFSRDGLAQAPKSCQLTFDYGLSEFSLHLQDSCWNGKTVKDGACEGLTAKPEGEGKLVAYNFAAELGKPLFATLDGEDPRRSLHVRYQLRINEPVDHALHLYLKTSCKVGDKTWVEVSPDYPHVKPFKFNPGEMVPLGHGQFLLNPLPGEPESCQFSVQLAEKFDQPAETIRAVCFKDGEVAEEPCSPPASQPERKPVTADALAIEAVSAKWQPGLGNKGVRLNLLFGATVKQPVEKFTRLYTTATCDGTADKEHPTAVDLSQLDPGESALLSVTAFLTSPLPAEPKSCTVTLKAGPRSDAAIDVGELCIQGSDAKVGSCKAKAKKKKKAEPKDSKTDAAKPKDDSTKPKDDGTKPKDDGTQPKDDGTQPKNDGAKPKDPTAPKNPIQIKPAKIVK